jgi:hypothetical protein
MRGLAVPFIVRRMGSSRLLLGCILLTTAITAALIAALTSFWVQALAQAVDGQLGKSAGMSISISGQVNARTAAADEPVVRTTMRSVFGRVPYRLYGALWSDPLGLTAAGKDAPAGPQNGGPSSSPRPPPSARSGTIPCW